MTDANSPENPAVKGKKVGIAGTGAFLDQLTNVLDEAGKPVGADLTKIPGGIADIAEAAIEAGGEVAKPVGKKGK